MQAAAEVRQRQKKSHSKENRMNAKKHGRNKMQTTREVHELNPPLRKQRSLI